MFFFQNLTAELFLLESPDDSYFPKSGGSTFLKTVGSHFSEICRNKITAYNNVIKADRYKLNLYFNPLKRSEKICDIQYSVAEQSAEVELMMASKAPVADREDTVKRFNLLEISFNADDSIKAYAVNQKKLDTVLLTAGFFASKTIGVDFDPLQAMNNYGMRDEQEKCFALQKGPLGHDRLRTWS